MTNNKKKIDLFLLTVSVSKSAGNLPRMSPAKSSIISDGVRPSPLDDCFGNVRRILSKS